MSSPAWVDGEEDPRAPTPKCWLPPDTAAPALSPAPSFSSFLSKEKRRTAAPRGDQLQHRPSAGRGTGPVTRVTRDVRPALPSLLPRLPHASLPAVPAQREAAAEASPAPRGTPGRRTPWGGPGSPRGCSLRRAGGALGLSRAECLRHHIYFFFFLSFYKETKTRVNSYEHKSLKRQRRATAGLPRGRRDGVLEGGGGVCPEAAGGGPESRPGFTKIKMLQKKIKIIIIIIIVVVVNRVCQLPPRTVLCILAPGRSILLLLPPGPLAPRRPQLLSAAPASVRARSGGRCSTRCTGT